MHRVTVTLPEEIHEQLRALAEKEGVSVSHYIAYAIARQVEAVERDAQLAASVENSDARQSNSAGLPSTGMRRTLNNAANINQSTTLGINSVDVDHL